MISLTDSRIRDTFGCADLLFGRFSNPYAASLPFLCYREKLFCVGLLEVVVMQRVGVFCGSNFGSSVVYREHASLLGSFLAQQGVAVVYGGTRVGLMGAVADAALAAGGEVLGVIPQRLADKPNMAHRGLTELYVVESMHERKAKMAELADGFVALPGGLGTFEELFEMLTWSQLGFHCKPAAVLNIDGFYDKLVAFLEGVIGAQFMKPEHRDLLICEADPVVLLERMRGFKAPTVSKWFESV